MANAIEIEAKVLLKEEDYAKLAKLFFSYPHFTQTNHYIDSDDHVLGKMGIACRVREKDDTFEFTCKSPLSEGLLEKNSYISKEEFQAIQEKGIFPKCDTFDYLKSLNVDLGSLHILISLTTERIEVDYKGGVLCIDHNQYLGHEDYEAEYEYTSMEGSKALLGELLSSQGIPVSFSRLSKTARAMNALHGK